jgi:HK97 family phage major capsid protein
MKMNELVTKAQATVEEMETLSNTISTLKTGNDTEALKVAQEEYEAKSKAFDELEKDIATAKKREEALARVKAMANTTAPTEKAYVHVETTEFQKRKDELQCFFDFMSYKKMSDVARAKVAPKSESFSEKSGMETAVVPYLIKRVVLGDNVAKSMGSGGTNVTNTTGSNLVDPEFIARVQAEAFPVPQVIDRVTVVPTKAGDVTMPVLIQADGTGKFGGMNFQRIGEGAQKPDQNINWSNVRIQTHELAGSMQVSERLLSRSMISIEQWLVELSRSNCRYLLDSEILFGTGVNMCLGVINDAIRHVPRTTLGTVTYQDLVNLKYAIPPEDRARGAFVIQDECGRVYEGTTDTQGRPLFTASVANGMYDRLAGYPYVQTTNSPAVGAEGDMIFGNWQAYGLAVEEEFVFGRSEHYAFVNNMMTYKAYMVVGGRPLLPRLFTTLTAASS